MKLKAALVGLCMAWASSAAGLLLQIPDGQSGCPTSPAGWNFTSCSAASPIEVQPLSAGGGPPILLTNSIAPGGVQTASSVAAAGTARLASSSNGATAEGVGFRTGGAQDVENFRENINNGYLPLPSDITFEGVVKDYYFNTTSPGNTSQPCTELFCPVYSVANSADPVVLVAFQGPPPANKTPQYYVAVGLDSGLQTADVKRKPLNLVILLDQSGSMGSRFNEYYYDQSGVRQNLSAADAATSKMDVAKEVVTGILDLLTPGDRVSIVLFSTSACAPLPLAQVSCLDVAQVKADFQRDVDATDSTNMAAGYDLASQQLTNCSACMSAGLASVENRIIMITDAQPNTGDWSEEGLLGRLHSNADKNIFTTIIGVGLDFNTELVEGISKAVGANYYSVHSPGEFKSRLVDDFDYAVNPVVFNLELKVAPSSLQQGNGTQSGWRILHVYGSPNPNDTAYAALGGNGTITRVTTLFPSPKTDQGIKGGVVLLRVAPPPEGVTSAPLALQASYSDRGGQNHTSERTVAFPKEALTSGVGGYAYFQSTGVRKAVLLSRYSDLMRNWLIDEWRMLNATGNRTIVIPAPLCPVFPSLYCLPIPANVRYGVNTTASGSCELTRWLAPEVCILPTPVPVVIELNQWERQSQSLKGHVNVDAKRAIAEFLPYFSGEEQALGDPTLKQDEDILRKLMQQ